MRAATPTLQDYDDRLRVVSSKAHRSGRTIGGVPLVDVPFERRVSVVTITFNAGRTIEQTILSVLAQTYSDIEYVIVDGGSTDDTLDVIRAYQDRIAYWHSARDEGISDAFNVGIAASSGSMIAIVNADDWLSPDQIEEAVKGLKRSGADFIFGRLSYHAIDGSLLYTVEGEPNYSQRLRREMPEMNHPTLVARRSAYTRVGLYDLRWRIAMDYDWLLRAELAGLRGAYIPAVNGHLRRGGISSENVVAGLREVRDAAITNRQGILLPHLSYASRVFRLKARLALSRAVPDAWVDALHRRINPKYRPSVPGGASK